MNTKDLRWVVYCSDINRNEIKTFNIFNHSRFREDVEKYLKKYKDKEEFAEHLKRSLMYHFWSKCEWEVVITDWVPHITMKELDRLNAEREKTSREYGRDPYTLYVNPEVAEKIDVYEQVMNNWEIFLDYVWNSKIHRPRKKKTD
jgi:DNA-directed RNA polymerase specialized sigma subunit